MDCCRKWKLRRSARDAALNDRLNLMFRNEHIGFDSHEGEFFFRKDFKARVKVEGEGLPLAWTLRAKPQRLSDCDAGKNLIFQFWRNQEMGTFKRQHKMTFDTIYNLLAYLD